jgi:CubicO group peptidase (beta-lactamase class C family)
MKIYILILGMIASQLAAFSQDPLNDTINVKLGKAIAGFRDKYHCPGVSVAIVHGNDIVYTLSLGSTDLENKTAATTDSKYPIMSITKLFTATMLMQLKEKGIVGLDDDVKKYVPEYKVPSPTSLLQLATHNSGLPRNSPADIDFTVSVDQWMFSGGKGAIKGLSTNKELLRSLQFIQLEYPPFEFVPPNDRHYSNLGFSLLGIALERAAREEYTSYVMHHICQPLGMTHTGFVNEPGISGAIAKGYRYNMDRQTEVPSFDINSGIYAGGLYSTVGDLCRFISSQWKGEANAMMRQLKMDWKPAFTYVLHEGAFPGYRSIIVLNPGNRLGWVILTNGNDVDFNGINGALEGIIGGVYKQQVKVGLQAYTGTYSLPGGYGKQTISMRGDSLYSDYLQVRAMVPDGGLRWKVVVDKGYSIGYEFVVNGEGKVEKLKMGQFVWQKD